MQTELPRAPRGFTLIELMIVVAIVGILAAIATQDFLKMQCRAKQAEVRPNLRAILMLEEQHRAEHDRYGCVNDAACPPDDTIVFVPKGQTRFSYFATPTGANTFYAEAAGVDPPVIGDLWTITDANDVENIVNSCE